MIERVGNTAIFTREVNTENHKLWHKPFVRLIKQTASDLVYECSRCSYEKHVQILKGCKICEFIDNNTIV